VADYRLAKSRGIEAAAKALEPDAWKRLSEIEARIGDTVDFDTAWKITSSLQYGERLWLAGFRSESWRKADKQAKKRHPG